jgi:hypothetical protein
MLSSWTSLKRLFAAWAASIDMNTITGFLLGLLASVLVWVVTTHGFKPRLRFSQGISRRRAADEPGGVAYRIKYENAGLRAVLDVHFFVRFRVKGIDSRRPRTSEVTHLPVSFGGRVPVLLSRRAGRRHLLRVKTDHSSEFSRPVYGPDINALATARQLTLEHLLELNSTATVQVIAMGYDSFSGARAVFSSPEYTARDIYDAPFVDNSLAIVEDASPVVSKVYDPVLGGGIGSQQRPVE